MADRTEISWTNATWNPITGCSIESPGCNHCYAMRLAAGRLRNHPSRSGLTQPSKNGPAWTGDVRFNEQWLDQPLRWTRPRDNFVVAHGDLFHENVPDEWIDRILCAISLAPQHRYQILTKRTDRMAAYFAALVGGKYYVNRPGWQSPYPRDRDSLLLLRNGQTWPLPNVWLGTSVERQPEADKRRDPLRQLASAGWNTWVSYEPSLGLVGWAGWEFIRWLVSGGESGHKARPAHPDWYRAARQFCLTHEIPYFHKQNGNWLHDSQADADGRVGFYVENEDGSGVFDWPDGSYSFHLHKHRAGAMLDGREWKEMPQ